MECLLASAEPPENLPVDESGVTWSSCACGGGQQVACQHVKCTYALVQEAAAGTGS